MTAQRPASAPQTRIKTNRGVITVDSATGRIDGLWRLCRRELRTAAQVRKLAGGVARDTLLRWRRTKDFPQPVLTFPARAGTLELFSRTEVEAWLSKERKAGGA